MRLALLLALSWCCPALAQATVAGSTPASFRVTESGAAEYRIAIRVPPGIAGIEPRLALVYNSQAGNGLLGVGWSLEGLSTITRCPRTMAQDGARGGVNLDANDRFCLDGQRLMLVPGTGTYGGNGAEYRTERESFSKIISFGQAGSGPAWFKVWTKSGQILEYGNSADSRIEAQGKATARLWAANQISDARGNYLTLGYAEDNANGDYRPERIDYAGHSSSPALPGFSVRFSYETRPDITTGFAGSSIVRPGTRLSKVVAYAGETAGREYRLTYQSAPATGRSRLTGIVECAAAAGPCLSPVHLTWLNGGGGITAVENTSQVHNGNWTTGNAALSVADFNGDGYPDIFVHHLSGSHFCPGPGITLAANCGQVHNGNWHTSNAALSIADFNGDGYTDIFVHHRAGSHFCPGPGITLAGNCGQVHNGNWHTDNAALSVGDFNGDGYTDIFVHHRAGSHFCPGPGIAVAANCVQVHNGNWHAENAALSVADFNGDGYTDIFVHHPSGSHFCSGPGIALAANCVQVHNGNWHTGNAALSVADFNGDGYPDIFVHHQGGSHFCAGPGITVAANCVQVHNGNWYYSNATVIDGDFNADGTIDLFVNHSVGSWFAAGGAGMPDRVGAFDNGAPTAVSYGSMANAALYTKGAGAAFPEMELAAPLSLVSSVAMPDGSGGSVSTGFTYGGARIHLAGRGHLGFRWIEAANQATAVRNRTEFRQDWPYVGLPSVVRKTRSPGVVLGETTHTYGCVNPATDGPCEVAAGNRYFAFVSQSVETGSDLNGAALPAITTATQYDGFGNPTLISASTPDGHSRTTTNTYVNNPLNWLLGRLTRSTVQSTSP
jgi:hypothetical protein